MRYLAFVLVLLAGCSGIEQRQVYMEHPTKTHAEFNADWLECSEKLPVIYRLHDWPVHSYQVARCMESRKGWHAVELEHPSFRPQLF